MVTGYPPLGVPGFPPFAPTFASVYKYGSIKIMQKRASIWDQFPEEKQELIEAMFSQLTPAVSHLLKKIFEEEVEIVEEWRPAGLVTVKLGKGYVHLYNDKEKDELVLVKRIVKKSSNTSLLQYFIDKLTGKTGITDVQMEEAQEAVKFMFNIGSGSVTLESKLNSLPEPTAEQPVVDVLEVKQESI